MSLALVGSEEAHDCPRFYRLLDGTTLPYPLPAERRFPSHMLPAFKALGHLPFHKNEQEKYVRARVCNYGLSYAEEMSLFTTVGDAEPKRIIRDADMVLLIFEQGWQALAFSCIYSRDRKALSLICSPSWEEVMEMVYNVLLQGSDGDMSTFEELRDAFKDLHSLAEFCADEQSVAFKELEAERIAARLPKPTPLPTPKILTPIKAKVKVEPARPVTRGTKRPLPADATVSQDARPRKSTRIAGSAKSTASGSKSAKIKA